MAALSFNSNLRQVALIHEHTVELWAAEGHVAAAVLVQLLAVLEK